MGKLISKAQPKGKKAGRLLEWRTWDEMPVMKRVARSKGCSVQYLS